MLKTPYHLYVSVLLSLLFQIIIINPSVAIESEANREEIVTARSKRFYRGKKSRKYIAFGGVYSSDYNSKDFDVTTRYLHQTQQYINELNFRNENKYADKGSGENKQYRVKKAESYDLVVSSKRRFSKESKYYTTLFHRTLYDDMSAYYYDIYNGVGFGKMIFNDKTELDISAGYRNTKYSGNSLSFIPSIRTNFRLSKHLKLIQKGYLFINHESTDNGIKTRLSYRLNHKLSIELRHNFEQRRYEDDRNRKVTNLINRSITFGIIFDL